MIVLVVWVAALVVVGLMLGLVALQLVGQVSRTQRALQSLRRDVQPRVTELVAQIADDTSTGRHSIERLHSKR